MRRVLIGHSSELFARSIARKLGSGFDVRICLDGIRIGQMLDSYQPDVLILHSAMPRKDTLTILSERPSLPKLTILTVNYLTTDQEWKLRTLGVEQIMLMPSPNDVVTNLHACLAVEDDSVAVVAYRVRMYLLALDFDTNLDGFRLICSAVPLLLKDSGQTLSKHVYPTVAGLHRMSDQRAVEHSIRNSIEKAWRRRNEAVWNRFFSSNAAGQIPCPSNRKLLTSLAEWISAEEEREPVDG